MKTFSIFSNWILQPNVGNARCYTKMTRGKWFTNCYPNIITNILKSCLMKYSAEEGLIICKTFPVWKNFFGGKHVETRWIEQKKKTATMPCCSQHRVPINFFDDPCIQWTTGFKCSNDTFRLEIVKIYDELRPIVLKSLRKSSILITFDGWTITVTKEKHLFLLYFKSSPGRALFSGKAWWWIRRRPSMYPWG